jgi:hypothetical protein
MIVPMNRFLDPDETDVELLKLYCQGLFSGAVAVRFSPVMYLIAVHHINRFIYTVESTHRGLKYAMIRQIFNSQDEVVFILFYRQYLHIKSDETNKNNALGVAEGVQTPVTRHPEIS